MNSSTKLRTTQPKTKRRKPASLSQKFAWIDAIMADRRLSSAAKTVAMALLRFHNETSGQCNPRQQVLADAVGVDRKAVNASVAKLVEAGWIVIHRSGSANDYVLCVERAARPERVEMSGREDNATESRCPAEATSDVPSAGHPLSRPRDTEPLEEPSSEPSLSARTQVRTTAKRHTSASGGSRKQTTKSAGTPWPANLELDDHARELARQQGITSDVEGVWADFQDHALSEGRTSHNWMAAWSYWCRRARERMKPDSVRTQREQPKPSRFQIPRNGAYPPQAA